MYNPHAEIPKPEGKLERLLNKSIDRLKTKLKKKHRSNPIDDLTKKYEFEKQMLISEYEAKLLDLRTRLDEMTLKQNNLLEDYKQALIKADLNKEIVDILIEKIGSKIDDKTDDLIRKILDAIKKYGKD